jgi:hypothetical protein
MIESIARRIVVRAIAGRRAGVVHAEQGLSSIQR